LAGETEELLLVGAVFFGALFAVLFFLVLLLPEGAVRFPPAEARPVVFLVDCAIFLQAPFIDESIQFSIAYFEQRFQSCFYEIM
jgi:hypothetical protein